MKFKITTATDFKLSNSKREHSHLPTLGTIIVNGNTILTAEQYSISGFESMYVEFKDSTILDFMPSNEGIYINEQVNELYLHLLNILEEEFNDIYEKVTMLELLLLLSNCRFNSYVRILCHL